MTEEPLALTLSSPNWRSPGQTAGQYPKLRLRTGHAFSFRGYPTILRVDFFLLSGTINNFRRRPALVSSLDSGVRTGSTVPPTFNYLLAKLIVWAP
ncbi:hypothetical protein ACVXG7_25620 [Enterobacter hormaechei]